MEKPIQVQVAEALGWRRLVPANISPEDLVLYERSALTPEHAETWIDPEGRRVRRHLLPRYDTSWAATGPLIERFDLKVEPSGNGSWEAWANETAHGGDYGEGQTPLIAICNLILELHAAGKLHSGPRVDGPRTAAVADQSTRIE